MTGSVVISEVVVLVCVVLSMAEKYVSWEESVNTTEYITLQARCRTNRGRYNRIQLYLEAYVKCLYKTLAIYCITLQITKHVLVARIIVLCFSFQRNQFTSFPPGKSDIFYVCFSSH